MKLNKNVLFVALVILVLVLTACGPVSTTRITVIEKTQNEYLGVPLYHLYLQTCELDENGRTILTTCTYETISVGPETYNRNSAGSEYKP